MNDKRPLIVTGLVLILIIALIGGVIFYLVNFIRSRQATDQATRDIFPRSSASIQVINPNNPNATPTSAFATPVPVATAVPNQVAQQPVTGITNNGNSKTINGQNFQLTAPQNWGVLTCLNSKNIELDPYNANDVTANCVKAVKPITILVNKNSCVGGQVITLGNVSVRKVVDNNFVTRDGRGVQYHWCTQTSPSLDITHRVGTGTAFSKDDFSVAVEQLISTMSFSTGS